MLCSCENQLWNRGLGFRWRERARGAFENWRFTPHIFMPVRNTGGKGTKGSLGARFFRGLFSWCVLRFLSTRDAGLAACRLLGRHGPQRLAVPSHSVFPAVSLAPACHVFRHSVGLTSSWSPFGSLPPLLSSCLHEPIKLNPPARQATSGSSCIAVLRGWLLQLSSTGHPVQREIASLQP